MTARRHLTLIAGGKSALLGAVLVTLAGCARWGHPVKTRQDFFADRYACQRESTSRQLYGTITMNEMDRGLFNNCMYARGYRKVYPWTKR